MKSQYDRGFTLLDTMVVVAIMATFAVIAFPSFTSSEKYNLDLAKNEVVASLRFARSEAMRTGDTYGVDVNRSTKQITVYKADLSAVPVGHDFIANHPINKNHYDYNLATDLNISSLRIANTNDPFLFTDSTRRGSLLFNHNGMPIWFESSTGSTHQLSSGSIELALGIHEEVITVQPFSGKVTIQ